MKNYTQGDYRVFNGRGPLAVQIGQINNDEYVRTEETKVLYRICGKEVYDLEGIYLGDIQEDGNEAWVSDANQKCLFMIDTSSMSTRSRAF
jgi:hypothetical protein